MTGTSVPGESTRLRGIDWLRGFVMVVMLLDHTRDFVHDAGMSSHPLDEATSTPLLYFTRWITHLCAPTFVFLAGASAGIQSLRGTSRSALSRFLFTRGLWLVVLELAVVRPLMMLDFDLSFLGTLGVFWAIGCGMIALAALIRLPMRVVGGIGLAIVLGHNLLDQFRVPAGEGPGALPSPLESAWIVLHQGGLFRVGGQDGPLVYALYPVLPWIGVMAGGYAFAEVFAMEPARRRRFLATLGIGLIALFAALRLGHFYGDPIPWSVKPTVARTIMSFLNVQKYGPSLHYVCATLGPALLLLAWAQARPLDSGPSRALVMFGRVPLFFYLLQWVMAHLGSIVVTALEGKSVAGLFDDSARGAGFDAPPDVGGPLWTVYACWAAGTILLWFPCHWYAGVKARRKDLAFLRYL